MSETLWRDKVSGNQKLVEERLSALQAKHRLAIHMFEYEDKGMPYPTHLLDGLAQNPAHEIPALLRSGWAALFSVTLLPSTASNMSVLPFEVSDKSLNLGYLFDLSTNSDAPARALRLFTNIGITGKGIHKKKFRLGDPMFNTGFAVLDNFYNMHNKHSLMHAVADDIDLSATQLDMLGRHYDSVRPSSPTYVNLNEVLIAASKQHITAITVPVFDESLYSQPDPLQGSTRTLAGALSGLDHARRGIDIPVVYYHVTPPNQGRCTYLAQGEEECKTAALKAIDVLQHNPRYNAIAESMRDTAHCSRPDIGQLYKDAERLLGVDIFVPLAAQNITVAGGVELK